MSIGPGATGDTASNDWGRVAEDGTVFVRTGDGERPIGSWQAGPAAEGLAHYSRRYDDLATEVALLDQRLGSGAADPKSTLAAVRRLRESLPTATVVGDLAALASRLDEVQAKADKRQAQARAERQAQTEQAIATKQALVEEAEKLAAEATQWKVSGDRLREIVDGWKDIRGVDRKTDAALWKRLSLARATFTRRRGTHFAQLDQQRKESQEVKEGLIKEAESLADSTEWGPTARRLRDLMTEWKAAPRGGRDAKDEQWERFRAAQDRFFTARSEVFAARDATSRENQVIKERLIAEAEGLDLADPRAAQDRLRDIQDKYEKAGQVPRDNVSALDARMRAAEQQVREAVEDQWARATASSNPLLDQMREQVGKAEKQVARAKAAGDDRALRDAEAALATRREFLEQAERSTR
ncbi:MAG: DUF349 domain-containing protein [Mycobacteriales bacterium]